ncbi:hypothetical protein GCM10010174_80290 [Kutzneria viridogrisea]|uniref:Uncharacterized protein n=2 Tax=Kutzneria TaxID=43356 RepID=W5WBR0_9PSEU|nr:hypothetical protein [Kutzneria albida]AHH98190.1 hypothetical protein KALB_4828 [Kutzneria albida DSM 43870]MBA8924126.1 hypothetical protein [Kutzneria viridogrisea]
MRDGLTTSRHRGLLAAVVLVVLVFAHFACCSVFHQHDGSVGVHSVSVHTAPADCDGPDCPLVHDRVQTGWSAPDLWQHELALLATALDLPAPLTHAIGSPARNSTPSRCQAGRALLVDLCVARS